MTNPELDKINYASGQDDTGEYLRNYLKDRILSDSGVKQMYVQDQLVVDHFGSVEKTSGGYFDVSGFVDFYLKSLGSFDPKMKEAVLKDERLLTLFSELKLKELEFKLTDEERRRYLGKIEAIIYEHVKAVDKGDHFNNTYKFYAIFERMDVLRDAVFKTGNADAIRIWVYGEKELKAQYKSGEIGSVKEYLEKADLIHKEAIEVADSEDLDTMWKGYSDSKDQFDESVELYDSGAFSPDDSAALPLEPDEIVVADPDVVKESVADVESSGLGTVKISDSGAATVDFGDNFYVKMHYVENSVTSEGFFYIVDENSSEGPIRVDADAVVDVLDGRHLDGYFTGEIKPLLDSMNLISEIPDDEILPLFNLVVGDGEERGFTLSDSEKMILSAFAQFLTADSDLDLGLSKKFELMRQYIVKREDGAFFAQRLLSRDLVDFDDYYHEVSDDVE